VISRKTGQLHLINSIFDTLNSIHWLTEPASLVAPSTTKITVLGLQQTRPEPLLVPKQVHGATILNAEQASLGQEGDAIYTRQKGVAIGVRTADCLPILFYSKQSDFIMAMHAGWKGFTKGIISEGIQSAKSAGILPGELNIFIGPAIGREAFEVGPEVVEAFAALLLSEALYVSVSKGARDRWHVDLQVAAALELTRFGILPCSIQVLRICTKSSLNYHSKRREESGFGHNYTIIKMGD